MSYEELVGECEEKRLALLVAKAKIHDSNESTQNHVDNLQKENSCSKVLEHYGGGKGKRNLDTTQSKYEVNEYRIAQ